MKNIVKNLYLITCLISISGCAFKPPVVYSYVDDVKLDANTVNIKTKSHFGGGVTFIRSINGQETSTHPDIALKVQSTANVMQTNFEPLHVVVKPGPIRLGVMHAFTDLNGKLVTQDIVDIFKEKYLPDYNGTYITIKQYEELSFEAKAGGFYLIDRIWNEDNGTVEFQLSSCDQKYKNCREVEFESVLTKAGAEAGWATRELPQ